MNNTTIEKFDRLLSALRTNINEGGIDDKTGAIQPALDELHDALEAEAQANRDREQEALRAHWRKVGPRVMAPPIDVDCTVITDPAAKTPPGMGGFGV